jgi:hypothetical protein
MPAQVSDRAFAIASHQRLVRVEAPAHLLLQAWVVFDNQQDVFVFAHE